MIFVDAVPNGRTMIGRLGENDHRGIRFPSAATLAMYPDAQVTVLHQRPGDPAAYPVPSENIQIQDGRVIWCVTSSDLSAEGTGTAELVYTQGTVIAKTEYYKTQIMPALDGSGTPPQPWESWQQGVKEDADRAEAAAELLEHPGVEVTILDPDEQGSGSYDDGTFTFNIPKGDKGDKGDQGDPGRDYVIQPSDIEEIGGMVVESNAVQEYVNSLPQNVYVICTNIEQIPFNEDVSGNISGPVYRMVIAPPANYDPNVNDCLLVKMSRDIAAPQTSSGYYSICVKFTGEETQRVIYNLRLIHYPAGTVLFEKNRVYELRYRAKTNTDVYGNPYGYDILDFSPGIKESVTAAEDAAEDARGWANGTDKNGNPVPSTDKHYENNAKYYAELTQAAETTAVQAINTAGSNQVQAVEDKGQEVLDSIPADYTELSGDVSDLKSAINFDKTATPGYILMATNTGTGQEWAQVGTPTDEQVGNAVDNWLDDHPEATTTVQDGAITRVKIADGVLNYVTPEMFGAVGDGEEDDSQAVQDAVDAGYAVYFSSGRTYFLRSTVTIRHDCYLFGGENTKIKILRPSNGSEYDAFIVQGTLKKTTTLTTDYVSDGSTDNSGNQFTLSDMTDISIGDILHIQASDQNYSYARPGYYLGATLLVSDIYDGHIYTSEVMPYDIENTENVTVKVYNAPTAIIENLNFVSQYNGIGSYKYFVRLAYCKDSVVRKCSMTDMDNGIRTEFSVNTLIDNVTVSKSKYDNNISADGYGIFICSSSNTIVRRVMAICSQGCIDLGGSTPNLNTYIYNCNLFSQCRPVGVDSHENMYNTIVEDCVIGGLSLYGTAKVSRCRFVPNNRVGTKTGITFRGTHNPDWATLTVRDCTFEDNASLVIERPVPQSPLQSYENIIKFVDISDCEGGILRFLADTTSDITGNRIKRLSVRRWNNCDQFARAEGNIIEKAEIIDSTFVKPNWINKSHGGSIYVDGINYLCVRSTYPQKDKLFVDLQKNGMQYYVPSGIDIAFTSSDTNGHYVVCGKNTASNVVSDYDIGSVSGSVGSDLTRTHSDTFNSALSVNQDGCLVLTYPTTSATVNIYPKCLCYTQEKGRAKMSVKLKNTGTTDGAGFRTYIAVVDASTGKITYRYNGQSGTASAEGVTITHSVEVAENSLVLFYLYCYTVVSGSKTTFENFTAAILPYDFPDLVYEPYNGSSRDGNGSLTSVQGINNILATPASFDAKFKVEDMFGFSGGSDEVIPTGGTTGQVLSKRSGTNFDTEWTTPSAGTIVETVSGSTPSITGVANHRYICGECSTLSISAPASGCIDVLFESGSTPTALTVTSAKTGVTAIKWPVGFSTSSIEADTVYELNIMDGEYGVVGAWS